MKRYLINFVLWLYTEHIQEDWDDYTKVGKVFCYIPWAIRGLLIWVTFPFWIPVYNFTKSKHFAAYQELGDALTADQMRMINQMQTQNFLNRKATKRGKK